MHDQNVTAPRRNWMVSVFGDITQNGSWRPDEKLLPIAVFGDVTLDLRQADIGARDVKITSIAPFGDIQVLVPEGVHVKLGGFTLFGSKRTTVHNPFGESAPGVHIRAFSLFGSASVWGP